MNEGILPLRYYRNPEAYLEGLERYRQRRQERDERVRQAVEAGYEFGSVTVRFEQVHRGSGYALVRASCSTCGVTKLDAVFSIRSMARAAYMLARFHCSRHGHEQDVQAFAAELERVKNLLYHNRQNGSWYSYPLTGVAFSRFDRLDTIFGRTR